MGDPDAVLSNGILLFLVLLFLSLLGGYFLKHYNCQYFQEAGLAILIGMASGGLLEVVGEGKVLSSVTRLNVEIFLLFLLPPIIFESGYNLNKRPFFKHIGGSIIYALLGTVVSTTVITGGMWTLGAVFGMGQLSLLECACFGAIISATDPVSIISLLKDLKSDECLYSLIFGESIFNDAVVIVLYRTLIDIDQEGSSKGIILEAFGRFFLIFLCSILIGSLVALIVSFVTFIQILKKVGKNVDRQNLEASSVVFGPWVSYLISEGLSMSGIVSILVCAIFMAKYTHPNLTEASKAVVGKAYSVIAHASENLLFIFLGMGLFSFKLPFDEVGGGVIASAVGLILLARGLSVVLCSVLVNTQRKRFRVTGKLQVYMWLAAPRGTIAFALAISSLRILHHGEHVLILTLAYSIFSILLIGAYASILLKKLNLIQSEEPFARDVIGDSPDTLSARMKRCFSWLDEAYLKPFFVSEGTHDPVSPVFISPEKEDQGTQLQQAPGSNRKETTGEMHDVDLEISANEQINRYH